jgi:hypothetical protein
VDFIQFDSIPNQEMIRIDLFHAVEIHQVMAEKAPVRNGNAKVEIQGTNLPSKMTLKSKFSKIASEYHERPVKVVTEEDLLADDGLWAVSDDSDSGDEYDIKKRNKDFYDEPEELETELHQMASFIVDRPPDLDRGRADAVDLTRKTRKERRAHLKR